MTLTDVQNQLTAALTRDGCDKDSIYEAMPELLDAYIELQPTRLSDRVVFVSGREYSLVRTVDGVLLCTALTYISGDD